MENKLFREKSIQRISSPEQLDDYIHLANPGVWMILAAVIVLLTGVCIWGIFGRLDTTIGCVCIADGGRSVVYVKEEQISSVREGMQITVDGQAYSVLTVGAEPLSVDGHFSEYALHTGGLVSGEWVYEAALNTSLPDGVYAAEIVIESVKPMSFLMDREGL